MKRLKLLSNSRAFLSVIAFSMSLSTIGADSAAKNTNQATDGPDLSDYTLLFEENFDGDTLNTNIWRYRIDRRTGMGYMNGLNRAENVKVKRTWSSHLILAA